MREPQTHYLGHNASERSPRRVVFLDTETRWETTETTEHHHLRLWVARLVVRAGDPKTTVSDAWSVGTTGDELRIQLERWHRTEATMWVLAHNLTFDLCTTRILTHLLAAGWELGAHALANDAPWARLKRARRRITLADSGSWLPRSVEHLGGMVRIPKPELPDHDDDDAVWVDRCRADVEILSTAMCELMDWWDRSKLGCWSLTGTATGWNSYRHHPEPVRPLIDPDPDARAFERQAIVAGRRDCWKVGQLPSRRYILIDLERAHLTAARCFPLPRRRGRLRGPMALDDWHLDESSWEPMLDVTVRTAVPRYPWRHQDRVWHPIGTFRTILAGPELREAQRRCELLSIHGGHLYLMGPIMTSWSRWLGDILDGSAADAPPTARLWAKMCSHRVFGKWAARTSRELDPYWSGRMGWGLETGVAHPEGQRMSTLHLDGWAHPLVQDEEGDDSFPAVLAWIQSHVRVALGRLVDQLDPDRLVSCNTDGVVYQAGCDPDMAQLRRACHPFVPRIKAEYRSVEVIGAAHLILDGHRRLSGVPSSASPTGETTLAWDTWPRMRRQLALGAPDGYIREHREVDLGEVPIPRWVLADGTTRPPMTMVDAQGETRLLPWIPGRAGELTPSRATRQHPVLEQLLTDVQDLPLLAARAW